MANPTVDYNTLIISIPQSYLTHLGGTSYSLDTMALKIALRDIGDSEAGIAFPPMLDYVTSKVLGGIGYAPLIEIINGYTITFEDVGTPYKVFLNASNNNILDVTNLNNVSVAPNNSAGLVQMLEIYAIMYGGQVQVDQVNGYSGLLVPTGSNRRRSNNFPDALQIAKNYGIFQFGLHGYIELATTDLAGYSFSSYNSVSSILKIWPSATVHNCQFREVTLLDSTLDGNNLIRDCHVSNLTYVEGLLVNCLLSNTLQIAGSTNTYLIDCKSGCVGMGASDLPKIDLSAGEVHVAIRNWAGPVKFINGSNAASTICVDIGSGATVIIDATCTAGLIFIRGVGNIVDNFGNRYVNGPGKMEFRHEAHLDVMDIADALGERIVEGTYTHDDLLRLNSSILAGKVSGAGTGTETFRDLSDTKDRATITVDSLGNRTGVTIDAV